MAGGEMRSLSAAPARTVNTPLSDSDVERMIRRLRVGMEKLADNASATTLPDRIVLRRELREFVPVDDSTLYRWERDPRVNFPKSFECSSRLRGHSFAEVIGWYLGLLERRDREGAGDAQSN